MNKTYSNIFLGDRVSHADSENISDEIYIYKSKHKNAGTQSTKCRAFDWGRGQNPIAALGKQQTQCWPHSTYLFSLNANIQNDRRNPTKCRGTLSVVVIDIKIYGKYACIPMNNFDECTEFSCYDITNFSFNVTDFSFNVCIDYVCEKNKRNHSITETTRWSWWLLCGCWLQFCLSLLKLEVQPVAGDDRADCLFHS